MGVLDSITGVAAIFLAVLLGLCALLLLEGILNLFGAADEDNAADLPRHADPHHRKAH